MFFIGCVALCGAEDLRRRKVPDALTLPLLAVTLAWVARRGSWEEALPGLAAAAALGMGGLLVEGLGGGDFKVMLAIGAALGPRPALTVFALAAVTGIVWASARLARRGLLRKRFGDFARGLCLSPALGLGEAFACMPRSGPDDPGAVPFTTCLAAVLVPAVVAGMISLRG